MCTADVKHFFSVLCHLIVFWKAIVVKTGKDKRLVEGLTVWNLTQKSYFQWWTNCRAWKSSSQLSPVWRRRSHWRKDLEFFCELLSQISVSCRASGTPAIIINYQLLIIIIYQISSIIKYHQLSIIKYHQLNWFNW